MTRTRFVVAALVLLAAVSVSPPSARAQSDASKLTFEVAGGIGFTAVDREAWSGTSLADWNQTHYGGAAKALMDVGSVKLGLRAGYQYFWWYSVPVPGYSYTRTYEYGATHVGALVRVPLGPSMAADLGASYYFFDGFSDPGLNAAIGYFVPLSRDFTLPIQVHADRVFDSSAALQAVSLSVGISYHPGAR